MVSKYSRVVLRDDILASPLPNVISGTQAKQTTFHKHFTTARSSGHSEQKTPLCL